MKYCPRCKRRMPADVATCPECGGPVRTIGGPAGDSPAAAGGSAEPDLALQLAGLQHQVQKSRTRLHIAAALAAVLMVLFIGLLVGLHLQHVWAHAEIANLKVELTQGRAGEAEVSFERLSGGRVEFVRETATRMETLVDHGGELASQDRQTSFAWSGGADEAYTLIARYRSGWSVAEKKWKARDDKIEPVP